ncbi:MAG: hypothetical protein PHP45_00345, partial [Elusimicrobiales bacterium]|nr:hypothetical protein [Elusimicrobiales bacterium]
MKKLLIVAAMLASGASASFAADSSVIKLSLFDKVAVPTVDTVKGLELGLIYSNTPAISGVQ